MNRPLATISVDVDPVDLHLVGYGFADQPADGLVYSAALPRLLERFSLAGVRATLFCVGRDAEAQAVPLRAHAAAGHEIASHTWSHPIRFARLPASRHRSELADSKRVLESVCGVPVVGFRAPNFDMHERIVPRLVAAGYRYDASAYPTMMLLASRIALALKSTDKGSVLRMKPWPFTWRRQPYDWRVGESAIREFPLSVTPRARMPVYHTLAYYGDERVTCERIAAFARRGEPLSYVLHAVDALGLAEDRVNPRLDKHPGMERKLGDKLALLDRVLRFIAERFEVKTFAERLDTSAAERAGSGE